MTRSAGRLAPRRATRAAVAPLTGLFVLLCVTCSLAPLGVAGAAFLLPVSCPTTDACGESCPYEKAPRPSECRSCGTAGCGFLVESRAERGVPATRLAALLLASPSRLLASAAATRTVAITASPPLHLLLATLRN